MTSIISLAIQYANAHPTSGKLADDLTPTYKVGYLSLSPSAFNAIVEAPVDGSSLAEVDYCWEAGDRDLDVVEGCRARREGLP